MIKINDYNDKLKAAIIGRFAGCALGAPVEMMEFGKLLAFCEEINQELPPLNYFKKAPNPDDVRYKYGKGKDFTLPDMEFLSTDDDIMYTLLSLIMMEELKDDFNTKNISTYWQKYLPLECTFTAERTTLSNLNNGVQYDLAYKGEIDETEYIGAAIRIDGYGYVYPGNPEKAIELAYQDAILTHRGSGLYSAIYFTAVISMAFKSTDITKTLFEALKYIPVESEFYKEISWALSVKEKIIDFKVANQVIARRYPDMSWAHSINNACLTVWGIYIGRQSFEKGLTETVSMAYDNDCTTATVGSVLGAYHGFSQIDQKWYKPWNNRILSYLNGIPDFRLDDVIERFKKLAYSKFE